VLSAHKVTFVSVPVRRHVPRRFPVCLLQLGTYVYSGLFKMIVGVQWSSDNSAPNSGNNHHLTILFEGSMQFQETESVCTPELRVQIRTAIETITADIQNELDYRVDVCRITKGAYTEHL